MIIGVKSDNFAPRYEENSEWGQSYRIFIDFQLITLTYNFYRPQSYRLEKYLFI